MLGAAAERPAAVEEEEAEEDPSAEAVEDDKTIAFKLYELLRQADMEVSLHSRSSNSASASASSKQGCKRHRAPPAVAQLILS